MSTIVAAVTPPPTSSGDNNNINSNSNNHMMIDPPTNNPKKKEDEEEANHEELSKPATEPPPASPPASPPRTAHQRWTLLRTVTRAQTLFRRSLQEEEHALLQLIHSHDDDDDDNDRQQSQQSQSPPSEPLFHYCANRRRLSQVLPELPPQEAAYLRKLIQNPRVPSELVAQAHHSVQSSRQSLRLSHVQELQQQQEQQSRLEEQGGGDEAEGGHDDDDHDHDDDDEKTNEKKEEEQREANPTSESRRSQLLQRQPLDRLNAVAVRKELWNWKPNYNHKKTTDRTRQQQQQQQQQQSLADLSCMSGRSILASSEYEPSTKDDNYNDKHNNNSSTDDAHAHPLLDCSSVFFHHWCGSTALHEQVNEERAQELKEKEEEKKDNPDDDDEEHITYTILGTTDTDNNPCHAHVLTPPLMHALRRQFPTVVQHDNYWLKYSLARGDGASMRLLVHVLRNSARTVLAVETTDGHVVGAFCSAPWTPHGTAFFGSGEAFVWRLAQPRCTTTTTTTTKSCDSTATTTTTPPSHEQLVAQLVAREQDVQLFPWSGRNRNVQRLERADGSLMLGGGGPEEENHDNSKNHDNNSNDSINTTAPLILQNDNNYGSALVLSPDLERGYSNPCLTFQSPPLPPTSSSSSSATMMTMTTKKGNGSSFHNNGCREETFEIANLEVWTLTPVDTIALAEKVELGRRFIFEHGAFLEP